MRKSANPARTARDREALLTCVMHIVRVAISRRDEAAWPRSHKCRSAASRICSRRPTRSVGPGTDLQFFGGLLRRSHPVSCFWRPPHTAAGQRSCRSRWHSRCRRRGPVRAKIRTTAARRAASTGVPHHGLGRGSAGPALGGSQKEAAAGLIQERPDSWEEADEPGPASGSALQRSRR